MNPANSHMTSQGAICQGCALQDAAASADVGDLEAMGHQGSLGLGLLAGVFGGCIGLVLVYLLAKGSETKKGAAIGFGIQAVLGILIRLANS